jgi:hypothetical protein
MCFGPRQSSFGRNTRVADTCRPRWVHPSCRRSVLQVQVDGKSAYRTMKRVVSGLLSDFARAQHTRAQHHSPVAEADSIVTHVSGLFCYPSVRPLLYLGASPTRRVAGLGAKASPGQALNGPKDQPKYLRLSSTSRLVPSIASFDCTSNSIEK